MEEEYIIYSFNPVRMRNKKFSEKFGDYSNFESDIISITQGDENANIDINLEGQKKYLELYFQIHINEKIEEHPERLEKIKLGIENILGVKLSDITN